MMEALEREVLAVLGSVPPNDHLTSFPNPMIQDSFETGIMLGLEDVRSEFGEPQGNFAEKLQEFFMEQGSSLIGREGFFENLIPSPPKNEISVIEWEDSEEEDLFKVQPLSEVKDLAVMEVVGTGQLVVPFDVKHPNVFVDFTTKNPLTEVVELTFPEPKNLFQSVQINKQMSLFVDWRGFDGKDLVVHDPHFYIREKTPKGTENFLWPHSLKTPFHSSTLKNAESFMSAVTAAKGCKTVIYVGSGTGQSALVTTRFFKSIHFLFFDPCRNKIQYPPNVELFREVFDLGVLKRLDIDPSKTLLYSDVFITNISTAKTLEEEKKIISDNMLLQLKWYKEGKFKFFRFKVKPDINTVLPKGGRFSFLTCAKNNSMETSYLAKYKESEEDFYNIDYNQYTEIVLKKHSQRSAYFVSPYIPSDYDSISFLRTCAALAKKLKKSLSEVVRAFHRVPDYSGKVSVFIDTLGFNEEETKQSLFFDLPCMDARITGGPTTQTYDPKMLTSLGKSLGYTTAPLITRVSEYTPSFGASHVVFFPMTTLVSYFVGGKLSNKTLVRAGRAVVFIGYDNTYKFSNVATIAVF